jgi:restriction system protein
VTLWVVRGGRRGERERYNLAHGVCTFGWPGIRDLAELGSREAIRHEVRALLPRATDHAIANWSGQIFSFGHQIEPGDLIAMPLRDSLEVAFGQVTGSYSFDPGAPEEIGPHRLPVRWASPVARADLDNDIRRSLRGQQTLFRPQATNAESQIRKLIPLP